MHKIVDFVKIMIIFLGICVHVPALLVSYQKYSHVLVYLSDNGYSYGEILGGL